MSILTPAMQRALAEQRLIFAPAIEINIVSVFSRQGYRFKGAAAIHKDDAIHAAAVARMPAVITGLGRPCPRRRPGQSGTGPPPGIPRLMERRRRAGNPPPMGSLLERQPQPIAGPLTRTKFNWPFPMNPRGSDGSLSFQMVRPGRLTGANRNPKLRHPLETLPRSNDSLSFQALRLANRRSGAGRRRNAAKLNHIGIATVSNSAVAPAPLTRYNGQPKAALGRLAQRLERLVHTEEVGGSNPPSPTRRPRLSLTTASRRGGETADALRSGRSVL